jgi:hypothetical protein
VMTDQELRDILAEELLKQSDRGDVVALANMVKMGHDNSWGGVAAISAMRRVRDKIIAEQVEFGKAYVRLRELIGQEAFDTPFAPTPRQVWDVTEAALKKRLGS